jgi:glycosyltransferase 2 family protein
VGWFKFIGTVLSVGFLVSISQEISSANVIIQLQQIGTGFVVMLLLYFISFMLDTLSWQLIFHEIPLTASWLYRLFQVRLCGEAFNAITPLAGMGGEPIKVLLLKHYNKVARTDATTSLILAKSINALTLIMFLCIGFYFALKSPYLGATYKSTASCGLILLSIGMGLFLLIQRYKITSTIIDLIPNQRLRAWAASKLTIILEIEDKLAFFYTEKKKRLLLASILALSNWIMGIFEIYFTLLFIGEPINIVDALIIETATQLVRTTAFFVPSGIGVQESTFVLVGSALTGSPASALATALIRRTREIIWIVWGILTFYFLRKDRNNITSTQADCQ